MPGCGQLTGLRCWLTVSCVCWLALGCVDQATRSDLSVAERREDLAYLATVFADREQSFTTQSRAVFEARLAALESSVASMSHDAFIAGIQWAVAAADNGHTETLSHEHQRLRLPVALEWFADGLYVIAARPGYEALLGARVEFIEAASPEELLATLDSYAPGTDEHVRIISGYFLERPELLAAIGQAGNADRLNFTFALPDGTDLERTLPGQFGESTANADDARRILDDIDPLPLYLRDPGQSALWMWLPELDAIYVRINQNHDKALPEKLEEVLTVIRDTTPRNVIVDLRLNGGGNYELTAPFAETLPGLIPDDGRLVLVVGNRTFSAGIVTAAILKSRGGRRVSVVGERIGDELQFWSEGDFLALPNSGLRIHYSDGYHDWANGFDPQDPRNHTNPRIAAVNQRHSAAAGNLDPDISVSLTFGDYAVGRDPVMAKLPSLLGVTAP